ncbi:MAG TPA: TadE family protein [Terriglobia bacterium]|nr:TadE family protein [Terriglobia bacterium]
MRARHSRLCQPPRLLRSVGSEDGETALESALVITLLLSLVFGIIGFGHALYTYHFVANAAREATRWASVRGYDCKGLSGGCPAAAADVQTYVSNAAGTGLNPANLTVNTTWLPSPSTSFTPPCSTYNNYPGCVVQVQVVYKYQFFMPLLPSSSFNMQSTSQMVITQ